MTDYFQIFYRPGLDSNGCQDAHWQAFWEIGNQSLVSINGNHFLTYKNTRTANSKMCPPKINTFFSLNPKFVHWCLYSRSHRHLFLRGYGKANEVVWLWCEKVTLNITPTSHVNVQIDSTNKEPDKPEWKSKSKFVKSQGAFPVIFAAKYVTHTSH